MAPIWIYSLLVLSWAASPQRAPSRDVSASLAGGGEVSIRNGGDYLHVSVTGPRAGLASLCVGDDFRVRILHAPAALGEARYERNGERWLLKSGFEWKLRDSPSTGEPTEAQGREFLASAGWLANASNAGIPERTFRIRPR